MTKRLIVGTGITENYYPRTQHFRYFETLDQITSDRVQVFAVLVDPSEKFLLHMVHAYPHVVMIPMRSADVKVPNPNGCLQHGAFVGLLAEVMRLDEQDCVIFTDSDMTVQRPFSTEEVDLLTSGLVFSAMNWHPRETLAEELPALQPTVPPFAVAQAFPGIDRMLCLNTGVLGMAVRDWRRLLSLYIPRYPLVAAYMTHYARQQWLLCWLLQSNGFQMFDPNSDFVRTVHTHGHEPYRAERLAISGASVGPDGLVSVRGRLVVFAHNLK